MAEWMLMSAKPVFGDENRQCSECGYNDWQTRHWWEHALYCPACGTRMAMTDCNRDSRPNCGADMKYEEVSI